MPDGSSGPFTAVMAGATLVDPLSAARAAWIGRVLGVDVTAPRRPATDPATIAADWAAARMDWQDATEAVDQQIGALQAVLRRSGDDQLEEIAQFGLNGISGNHRVKVSATLMELRSGAPAALKASGAKAIGLLDAYRNHLETSEAVEVCDANPFDVPLAIRATLVPALTRMVSVLRAATLA